MWGLVCSQGVEEDLELTAIRDPCDLTPSQVAALLEQNRRLLAFREFVRDECRRYSASSQSGCAPGCET